MSEWYLVFFTIAPGGHYALNSVVPMPSQSACEALRSQIAGPNPEHPNLIECRNLKDNPLRMKQRK